MKKFLKIKYLFLFVIICFSVFWGKDLIKCEYLTCKYGSEFSAFEEVNRAYEFKVLNYYEDSARIYCVNYNRTNGTVYSYIKEAGKWKYNRWEAGGWSTNGTADGVVWPYWYHTVRAYIPLLR